MTLNVFITNKLMLVVTQDQLKVSNASRFFVIAI